ncbi:uncharacterized protein LOC118647889 [Monomorium pharaonis]|uniref:uncharacterized protein LOC118647889 n=1 Tax=Monomorium pharaonis TaxID=307658 RepID=UPI00174704BA|nr:uncharacterized protein LOC118647889 [Monomorium pharaonis]
MMKKNQYDKKNETCTLNRVSEVKNKGINNEQEKQQVQENEKAVVEQSVHNQTIREIDAEICAKETAKFCDECSSISINNNGVQNNCQCPNIEVENDSDDVPNIIDNDVLQELKENLDIVEDITNKVNKEVYSKNKIRFINLLRNDEDLIAFTGVSFQLLQSLIKAVTQVKGKNQYKFGNCVQDRIVLRLCKLRLNMSFRCLAALFNLTRQSCTNNFVYMVQLLAQILKSAIHWPSIEEIHKSMPICFEKFKSTYVVLDCTEIPVEKPRCLNCRLKLYSHYKGCETIKLLIGIAPCGLLSFLSEANGGRASDKAIFNQSGIINKLEPTRDAIMVDKGFHIESECMQNHIQLIMPPKLEKKKQFNAQEALLTKILHVPEFTLRGQFNVLKCLKLLNIKYHGH